MNKFSINSYVSLMNTEGSFWVIGDEKMHEFVNFIINISMVGNRWIYQLVDLGLQIFMSNTVFEDTIGTVFNVAISLYTSLFANLGATLFIVALASIFIVFAFSSPQEAFRKVVVLFLVIGINGVIYSRGEEYLTDLNNIFDDVENVVSSAVALPMFGGGGDEFIKETNANEQVAGTGEETIDTIRETYFKLTMQQAFAMVNFGTPEYKEEYDKFLYTVEQENDKAAKNTLKDYVKEASEDNRYLTPDGGLDKIFISNYALISNLFVGAPLLLIAIAKFLLKILILLMVFGLPILSILSLIPKFANSIFNGIGKMMLVFCIGVFLTVAIYMFFFIMTLIDSSVIALAGAAGGASLISCVLAAVVKIIVVVCIWKFRNQIASFVSGGKITNINSIDKRMLRGLRTGKEGTFEKMMSFMPNRRGEEPEESFNPDNSGVDSRDIVHGLTIRTWEERPDLEEQEQPDSEYAETNENRADTESIEREMENEEWQAESPEIDRVELEGDNELEIASIDPVEVLPADLEKLEVEEPDPLEIDSIHSLEAAEPPEDNFSENNQVSAKIIEMNPHTSYKENDVTTIEEPPKVNYEEFYETLEMLRNG